MGSREVEVLKEDRLMNTVKYIRYDRITNFHYSVGRNSLDKMSSINDDCYMVFIKKEDGTRHRRNLPAQVGPNQMTWFKNNTVHNIHGPANIVLGRYTEYWLGGNRLSKEDWEVKRLKYLST